jgi:F0F1-type ATP synthase beta subunit
VPLDEGIGVPAMAKGPEQHLEEREALHRVLAQIMALPQAQREVATLFYVKDYSPREIAAFLDLPATTVYNRLYTARKKLKGGLLTMAKTSGRIVHVRGPVIDADFAPEGAPAVLRALTVRDEAQARECALAVAQHLDSGVVRCIAVAPAEWLASGMEVLDSGSPISAPIRADVLGEALPILLAPRGTGGPAVAGPYSARQGITPELRETGIKVIDLLCPYVTGGRIGITGDRGVGKAILVAELLHNLAANDAAPSLTIMTLVGPEEISFYHDEAGSVPIGTGSVQTIYIAVDDPTDPAAPVYRTASALLDATTYLSITMRALQIYPAVDPLFSSSRILDPAVIGQEHYDVAQGVRQELQQYREIQERMARGLGEQPSAEETLLVARARKIQRFLSQSFVVAAPYTGRPGRFVPHAESVRACRAILAGECDHLPENALYMIGSLADASA